MTSILHIFQSFSSFVKKDNEYLSLEFNTIPLKFQVSPKWRLPIEFIKQIIQLIYHFRAKVIVIQFAGFHSVLPVVWGRITGKSIIIICGGNDCHNFPSIRYGNYSRYFLRIATSFSLNNCTLILPKHESLWYSDYNYDTSQPNKQGIRVFNPKIKTPYKVITNGYNPEFWRSTNTNRKPKSFITVSGNLHLPYQNELKGIDLVLYAAKLLPEYTFTIAGSESDNIKSDSLTNVQTIGQSSPETLRSLFSSHQYYLQLSLAEGFPNSLCEAMLCGCTPIGSNVFSIPEIIEDSGYILNKRDPALLIQLLKDMDSHSNKLKNPRERILENYQDHKRKDKLLAVLKSIISK